MVKLLNLTDTTGRRLRGSKRRKFRVLLQVQPDLLNQLPRLFKVAVIGDADRDLVDDPVAALVLNGAQQAKWHGVDRAAVVPQPDRTEAEAFDRAFVIAALDVLANPKRILQQEEDT